MNVADFKICNCDISQSTFEISDEIKPFLYSKKYPFSEEVLNVSTVCQGIFSGTVNGFKVSQTALIELLEHHANLGDEFAQASLYKFLKQPIGNVNLAKPLIAKQLLESAITQNRMWAIKVKINDLIKAGKSNSYGIVNYYIMAAHQGDVESKQAIASLLRERVEVSIPNYATQDYVKSKYSINKYLETGFTTNNWVGKHKPWLEYGCPLTQVGDHFLATYFHYKKKEFLKISLEYFTKAAVLGDVEAMYKLGNLKSKSNLEDSFFWLNKAASKGNKKASAILTYFGEKTSKLIWSTRAANEGVPNAMFSAGFLEAQDFAGHPPNFQKALLFYYSAIDFGDESAMCNAGVIEELGFEGHPANVEKAKELWIRSASLGNSEAMYYLGLLEEERYEKGECKIPQEAMDWYKKSALLGNLEAMYSLGALEIYSFDGHRSNYYEAFKWSTIAAEQGHVLAMNCLGHLELLKFQGHKSNLNLANFWFTKAVKEGHVNSMFNLSLLECVEYKGHVPDLQKAHFWCKLAAKQGEPEAMNNLGDLELRNYKGHKPNPAKAYKWFVKSAMAGCLEGKINAGSMERLGFVGHPVNLEKALEWCLEGAEAGNSRAMLHAAKIYFALDSSKYEEEALFWLQRARDTKLPAAVELYNSIFKISKIPNSELKSELIKENSEIDCVPQNSQSTQTDSCLNDIKATISASDGDGLEEAVVSTEWKEMLIDELSEYPDFTCNPPEFHKTSILQKKFKQISEKDDKLETFKISLEALSYKNILTWEKLNDPLHPTIYLADLIHFSEDNAFEGSFFHSPTSSGIMFAFTNDNAGKKRFGTVSTHSKHNKSYKGADKNFAKEFRDMVCKVLDL